MMLARWDAVWAAAAGLAAFALYVRTLAPGLVDTIDTPMFQFIGRVLGVPHNPGYPLYVLLTYPFSFLPVGSLPYRINLFSALFGALTVSVAFLIARRLGCRRTVSLAAALGLAFGQVFWSQAVIAEVYTLHAAIVAGMLLALLTWGQTRRQGFFFAAVALFAAGLGNHTTIVGFAPAAAVYALLTDRRFATRVRTLGVTAAILGAGLLQYGFILLRSRQSGAYVESPATTVGGLVDVFLARQFQDRVFAFDWRDVVVERLPFMVNGLLVPELTLPGTVLAAAGLAWLLRRQLATGWLFLIGCAAIVGFALVYSVIDTQVFLIPAILVLWLAAAVGAELAIRTAERWRWAGTIAALAVLVMPGWQIARNFTFNDRSRDTAAAIHFDALFDTLPSRATLVREDFLVDRMVMFKLLGDRSAEGRQIELVAARPDVLRSRLADSHGVFAFRKAARRLRYEAMNVGFRPVPLLNGSLHQFLSGLADGSIVAVAVPAGLAERFAASGGASFTTVGGRDKLAAGSQSAVALLGVRAVRRGAQVKVSPSEAYLPIAAGKQIGATGAVAPLSIEVRAGAAEASIRQDSRDILWTAAGIALAVWNPDGHLAHAVILEPQDDYRVPIPSGPLSVYPLRGTWPRQDVRSDRWSDIADAVSTGSVMVRVPARTSVVLYVGDSAPLAPRVIDQSSDTVSVDVSALEDGGGAASRAGGETDRAPLAILDGDRYVYRIEVTASDGDPVSVLLALGGVPRQAIGRVRQPGGAGTAAVFRVETDGLLRTPDRRSEVLLMSRDEQAQLTGAGWSPVDSDGVVAYRWMMAGEARLVLPIAQEGASRIRVQALLEGDITRPAAQRRAMLIGLRLNGTQLPPQPLRPGWHVYEWRLQSGTLPRGANDVRIFVDRLASSESAVETNRHIAVADVRVVHEP